MGHPIRREPIPQSAKFIGVLCQPECSSCVFVKIARQDEGEGLIEIPVVGRAGQRAKKEILVHSPRDADMADRGSEVFDDSLIYDDEAVIAERASANGATTVKWLRPGEIS